jgi:hypothetical protein
MLMLSDQIAEGEVHVIGEPEVERVSAVLRFASCQSRLRVVEGAH